MTYYKSIFKGRLEFGSPKSYEKVVKMYQHRVENYYKSDVLLNEEEIFDEEATCINAPRIITQGSEKSWKNTFSLLEYIAQFAVAGNMGAWMTEEGKILHHGIVEPKSDRVAVQAYIKGRELINEEGKEDEAMAALSKAIEKYERHAQAYEKRGHVNFILKNYKDAVYDYSKSIDLNPMNPEAYMGRGKIYFLEEKFDEAIKDLEMAVKNSIPLQPIYWKARRLKAKAHLIQQDFKGAVQDLKFYSKRRFKIGDPNLMWKRWATFNYGKALLETGEYKEAVVAFEDTMKIEEGSDDIKQADKLYYRGLALKKAGKTGFRKDLKEAAKMGSEKATTLLAEI